MVTVKWSLLFFVTVSVFLFTALHSVQAQTEGKQKKLVHTKTLSDERVDRHSRF